MTKPLQREPLYRQIYNELTSQIVNGQLKVGAIMPSETELAESYGVHRSSVREALRLLEESDMVGKAVGKKRLTVKAPQQENLSQRISNSMLISQVTLGEVYETILVLEPTIAGLVADRITPEKLAKLEENLANTREALNDVDRLEELDREFHGLLAEFSENRALQWSRLGMSELFYPGERKLLKNLEGSNTRLLKAHEKIVKAIKKNDRLEAEKWATKHVVDFRRGCDVLGYDFSSSCSDMI